MDVAVAEGGKTLHEAGVKVAYKSDHGVLNGEHLIFEAQNGAAYGLDPDAAFIADTSVLADRLGGGTVRSRRPSTPIWSSGIASRSRSARPFQVYADGVLGIN
ncbi:hypothetical protein HK101_010028 [Irineochytrium annulatum]|nr:hypothetical protein HK101_010028 [Irineochytrium annulatum]